MRPAVHERIFITELDTPADGPRLAVKDLFDTAGIRTTYGSAVFRDHVPAASAEVVVRLEAAGYVDVGKTNLHEFAWGITSENPHYGSVPNPLAANRIAGGSSGGSAAALAAGMADAALGSDSGGSIRIPAACCGVTGLKPTFGLVPIDGCFPLAPTFDHAGPMARDVAELERMMAALATGFEPVRLESLEQLTVAVAWTERADPQVRERVEAAAALFPNSKRIDIPLAEGISPVFAREAWVVHAELFRDHRELYGDNVATKLERAMKLDDAAVARASEARELYSEQIAQLLDGFDVVVTPTLEMVAPPADIGDLALRDAMIRLTFPWNAVGWPALALPCGPAELGLPASVQLVGHPGADALVLAAGQLLEQALTPVSAR